MSDLEIWGGVESTLNRVHDQYFSQMEKSGHSTRLSDLKLFSELGIKTLRYPALWELMAPERHDQFNWTWSDERMSALRELGINPIVGFLHHGSGPKYTSLIDPEFPEKFALYARAFAERYPWVQDYTPINEILTTARFSCLYGHWFPHHQSDQSFLQAVFLQCKATTLAMKEIQKINPKARLIQTDDIGRCQSTEGLTDQRDFENERRWLGYDVLSGRFTREHPLHGYAKKSGIEDEMLSWNVENPCPPDVIGLNHYHLSNRFLDERLELYPEWSHGGNGVKRYADVGAIDSGQVDPPKPASIMLEAWERFHIPVAITEVHTMGNREEQMRWFHYMYLQASEARTQGVDVKAITCWSLLGTFDWNRLCTTNDMFYEPGVFELCPNRLTPKLTGLGMLIKDLIKKNPIEHPMLKAPGYWETNRRVLFAARENSFTPLADENVRPLLIVGGGTLGQAFARICGRRNIPYKILSRKDLDISKMEQVYKVLNTEKPWTVVNTAGYVKVDQAESEKELCFRENVRGAVNLACACRDLGISFTTFSSDLVFDGSQEKPYLEDSPVSPLNVYGESKALSEQLIKSINPDFRIIRTSSFFGPWDKANFVFESLKNILSNQKVFGIQDIKITPTYVPDLVNAVLNLIVDEEKGLFHLTNQDEDSWYGFINRAVKLAPEHLKLNIELTRKMSVEKLGLKAKRPKNSTLKSQRLVQLPSFEDALQRYYQELDYATLNS